MEREAGRTAGAGFAFERTVDGRWDDEPCVVGKRVAPWGPHGSFIGCGPSEVLLLVCRFTVRCDAVEGEMGVGRRREGERLASGTGRCF